MSAAEFDTKVCVLSAVPDQTGGSRTAEDVIATHQELHQKARVLREAEGWEP